MFIFLQIQTHYSIKLMYCIDVQDYEFANKAPVSLSYQGTQLVQVDSNINLFFKNPKSINYYF